MNPAQTEIVDQHRPEIAKVLSIYSDAAIKWLRNERYLNRVAEDLALAEKTNLAKATCILDLLVHADDGWLGLTKCLQQFSNGALARTLYSELTSKGSSAVDRTDKKETAVDVASTQAQSSPYGSSEISSVTSVWLTPLQDKLKLFYKGDFSHVELFANDPASAVPLEKIWVKLRMADYITKETHNDYMRTLNAAFQSSLLIIVKGEPGVGKSTLVQKICYDWAIGRLPQFHLVLCGKMRAVSTAATLMDIALNWTASRCRGINFDPLKANFEDSNLNLLIILDGFDESVCQCDEVELLLKSREPLHLPFKLLITTRPYKLYEIACKQQLLTLCGFSLSQQLQFVANVCKLQRRTPISLQEKIKTTPSLKALCRIPLFIYFLCCLRDEESLDGSVTILLILLCEALIARYYQPTRRSTELANWRHSAWIGNLGAMALHGLINFNHGKLCFDNADLERFSIDPNNVAFTIGLLNREETVAHVGCVSKISVSFPHKVFQEFFAALALSNGTLLDSIPKVKSKLGGFLEMLGKDKYKILEMQQVLIFLAGMNGARSSLLTFLRSNVNNLELWDAVPMMQQMKIEGAHHQTLDEILRESFVQSYTSVVFLTLDWQLAVNVYNTYLKQPETPDIPCKRKGTSQLLFWDRKFTMCEAHFISTLDTKTVVDHLRDQSNELEAAWFTGTVQHLSEFAEILQMSQVPLKTLRVAVERGGEDTSVVWPAMPSLTAVVIESTDSWRTGLMPRAVQSLFEAQPAIVLVAFLVAEKQRVTSLDCHCWPHTTRSILFHHVNFDAPLISQLCQALARLHITHLCISKASVQLEVFVSLCQVLSEQRQLADLNLVSIRMDGLQSREGCHTFGKCFRRLTFLQTLSISDCGITDSVAECLLDSLQAMKDLKIVDLRLNPLSQAMKSKLRQYLERQNVDLNL